MCSYFQELFELTSFITFADQTALCDISTCKYINNKIPIKVCLVDKVNGGKKNN